jgi:hypothetical protein
VRGKWTAGAKLMAKCHEKKQNSFKEECRGYLEVIIFEVTTAVNVNARIDIVFR